jgi:hypothetical protein
MIGRGRQQPVESFERLARPAKLKQRNAAAVEQIGVVGVETKTFVKADQRPLEMPQRVEDEAQTGKALGTCQIALQRFLKKRQRRVEAPAPVVDLREAVQGIEAVGMVLEEFRVKPLGLDEFAVLQGAPCTLELPRRISLRAVQRLAAHRWVIKKEPQAPVVRGGRPLTAAKEWW